MKIIVCHSYDEMSDTAAHMVADVMKARHDAVLGLATGSTPIGVYSRLAAMNRAGEIDFSDVDTFNLDEYYPIAPDNTQSYRFFMNQHLFNLVNVDISRTHVPDGTASDPVKACTGYEDLLAQAGRVDVQLLGIGCNGHIGFNEPADALEPSTHVTALTQSTIKANARFFASEAEVPTHALTMGIGTILRAGKIIIMANGAAKRQAVQTMLSGRLTTSCPASFLNLHADVTLVCDQEAAGQL